MYFRDRTTDSGWKPGEVGLQDAYPSTGAEQYGEPICDNNRGTARPAERICPKAALLRVRFPLYKQEFELVINMRGNNMISILILTANEFEDLFKKAKYYSDSPYEVRKR